MLPVCSVRDVPGLYASQVPGPMPSPLFFITVDYKRVRIFITLLESTLADDLAGIDSK